MRLRGQPGHTQKAGPQRSPEADRKEGRGRAPGRVPRISRDARSTSRVCIRPLILPGISRFGYHAIDIRTSIVTISVNAIVPPSVGFDARHLLSADPNQADSFRYDSCNPVATWCGSQQVRVP
jgi:hypothetical protein